LRRFSRSQTRKEDGVSATVLYMSMSLDGFIAGPNQGPGNGLGDGGHRLHEWAMTGGDVDLEAARRSGRCQRPGRGRVHVHWRGRRRPADLRACGGWGGDHHDGVPICVFSLKGVKTRIRGLNLGFDTLQAAR